MSEESQIRVATDVERGQSLDCLRCGSVIRAESSIDLRIGGRTGGWSLVFGGLADVGEGLLKLDLFSCPKCGHVEFRTPRA
jgi:predicted RNA-binding Zn-ribbon protein involved in translation (DUF1610 family)